MDAFHASALSLSPTDMGSAHPFVSTFQNCVPLPPCVSSILGDYVFKIYPFTIDFYVYFQYPILITDQDGIVFIVTLSYHVITSCTE